MKCLCGGAKCRLEADDPRHGTANGYTNLRCRCEPCTHANTLENARRKKQRPKLAPDDPRHGTPNGYGNWNCRCRPCTDAWAADEADRRDRHRRGLMGETKTPKRRVA